MDDFLMASAPPGLVKVRVKNGRNRGPHHLQAGELPEKSLQPWGRIVSRRSASVPKARTDNPENDGKRGSRSWRQKRPGPIQSWHRSVFDRLPVHRDNPFRHTALDDGIPKAPPIEGTLF